MDHPAADVQHQHAPAVADEPNPFSRLRRELTPLLRLPGSASAGDLVHITLFRYTTPLRDPASLLRWLAATEFRLDVEVAELLIIRERVHPSLDYDLLHRLPLAPGRPALQAAQNSRSTIDPKGASRRSRSARELPGPHR